MMESSRSIQRALILFNRLRQGGADKHALVAILREQASDAYRDLTPKAEERKFERDLDKLRHTLLANVLYNSKNNLYELVDAGPLLSLSFSAESLRSVAFILEITEDNPEARAVIQPLLNSLEQLMGGDQLRRLEGASNMLRIDLQKLDAGQIAPVVWQQVRFAREQKRRLRFWYQSPNQPEGEPRLHVAEPHELRFERGHFYLRGYCVEWRNPQGMSGGGMWVNYRLDHIQSHELDVTPTTIRPRSQRGIPIRYKVAPRLWRGGLSQRFEKMEIVEVVEDGWAVISAETESLFYAQRVLLGYGALAVALEPAALVSEMQAIIQAMTEAYAFDPGVDNA